MLSIRVLIADDHQPLRQALRQICEVEGGFEVVGEAQNGQEAIEQAHHLRPDVILMDVEMSILDGVQATRLITEENPESRVIIMTGYPPNGEVFKAIQAGAQGCLLKSFEEKTLIEAIQVVHRGGARIDPRVTVQLLDEFRRISQGTRVKVGRS